jgi:hypothetical protein
MSENGVTIMNQTPKEIAAVAKPAPPAPRLFHLVPKDLNEAMSFAKMVADSDLVPKDYKGKAGNCLIGMQYGAELGLPPLQALQNIAVINGKPGVYGDLGKALLLSKGFRIEERDLKDVQARQEAWCKVTRPDGQVTERTFSIDAAKTAKLWSREGPWTTYPYRMMAWRAFWWAARDAAADVLKGIWGIEELLDFKADAVDTTTVEAPKELAPKTNLAEVAKNAVETATTVAKMAHGADPTPANPVVDVTPDTADPEPPKNGLNVDQRKRLVELCKENGVTMEILTAHLRKRYGITVEKFPTKHLTQDKFAELCSWIESPQDELGI